MVVNKSTPSVCHRVPYHSLRSSILFYECKIKERAWANSSDDVLKMRSTSQATSTWHHHPPGERTADLNGQGPSDLRVHRGAGV
eukprot:scaffold7180_cov50-Cyclotella_meneghiniana.AAC.2